MTIQDLEKQLFAKARFAYPGVSFDLWLKLMKSAHEDYCKRNNANLSKYGEPKTYHDWINGQILAL